MTFYVLYLAATGVIVGYGLVCNPVDLAGQQTRLSGGTALLQITQGTYQQVAARPSGYTVLNGVVTPS